MLVAGIGLVYLVSPMLNTPSLFRLTWRVIWDVLIRGNNWTPNVVVICTRLPSLAKDTGSSSA